MGLYLYNSVTRTKELFVPLDKTHVRLYGCGPTVYGPAHLGNLRPVVVADILYRLLLSKYESVTYVRNITDVDDKIIDQARRQNTTIEDITQRATEQFHTFTKNLGALTPTHEPRATQWIHAMVCMIESLLSKGHAYVAQGHVLFRTRSYGLYGHLSGVSPDDLKAGARVEVAPFKEDPMDFVLWKPASTEDPGWESPWGRGRPGWHIECSAMSASLLGVPFDVHAGGRDLLFPHHENESAQSCCAASVSFLARYWVHNELVRVEGQKMAKSSGNVVDVKALLECWRGEVLRWSLLASHYRQPLDWSLGLMREAHKSLERLYGALREVDFEVQQSQQEDSPQALWSDLPHALQAALLDDLNTPLALTHLHEMACVVFNAQDADQAQAAAQRLYRAGKFLGFFPGTWKTWFHETSGAHTVNVSWIETLLQERQEARLGKDFEKADQLRQKLSDQGVGVEDTSKGPRWFYLHTQDH